MGVHVTKESFDESEFNAKLGEDFVLRALKKIKYDDEIIITYDIKHVRRPGMTIDEPSSAQTEEI